MEMKGPPGRLLEKSPSPQAGGCSWKEPWRSPKPTFRQRRNIFKASVFPTRFTKIHGLRKTTGEDSSTLSLHPGHLRFLRHVSVSPMGALRFVEAASNIPQEYLMILPQLGCLTPPSRNSKTGLLLRVTQSDLDLVPTVNR